MLANQQKTKQRLSRNSLRSLFVWCKKQNLNPHAPKGSGFEFNNGNVIKVY